MRSRAKGITYFRHEKNLFFLCSLSFVIRKYRSLFYSVSLFLLLFLTLNTKYKKQTATKIALNELKWFTLTVWVNKTLCNFCTNPFQSEYIQFGIESWALMHERTNDRRKKNQFVFSPKKWNNPWRCGMWKHRAFGEKSFELTYTATNITYHTIEYRWWTWKSITAEKCERKNKISWRSLPMNLLVSYGLWKLLNVWLLFFFLLAFIVNALSLTLILACHWQELMPILFVRI